MPRQYEYRVRCYEPTGWSILTQADHYTDHFFTADEPLAHFAKDLATYGFAEGEKKWIMPGAILEIEQVG